MSETRRAEVLPLVPAAAAATAVIATDCKQLQQ